MLEDCASLRSKANTILDLATMTPEDLKNTVSAFKEISKIIGDLSKWYDIAGTPAAQIAIDNRSVTFNKEGDNINNKGQIVEYENDTVFEIPKMEVIE